MQNEISKILSKPGAKKGAELGLLIVILPDRGNYVKIEEVCESLDMVYQCITPWDDTVPRKQYLMHAARDINRKVVASMDWPGASKYKSVASYQSSDEFVIKDLFSPKKENGGMISELLLAFRQHRKQLPQRIILFRNGVIGCLVDDTYHEEIDAVREACSFLDEGYKPKNTFVVAVEEPSSHESQGRHEMYPNLEKTIAILQS